MTLPQPTLHHVRCAGAAQQADPENPTHRMAWWQWGDPMHPHVVVCVHGLSRQGRDFDVLARALSGQCQVICPDVVGRGESDWLADPSGYQMMTYASDMVSLLRLVRDRLLPLQPQLATEPLDIDWVGTSMGGLIGLALSAVPAQHSGVRYRRLVINDVGPRLRFEALQRIGDYLGRPVRFDTEQAAFDHLWQISTGFGPHTPEQWRDLSRPLLRPTGDGGWQLHYDPAIAEPFRQVTSESTLAGEAALWALYDGLTCPTLLLRGEDSDLLDAVTAEEMTRRGPQARQVTWPGVGHAPTLVDAQQVAVVSNFLLADQD